MRGRVLILGLLLALVAPATAEAQRPHHRHVRHHAHHTLLHHRAHKTGVEEEDDPLPWEPEVLEGDTESDGSESCATVAGPCTVVEG